MQMGSSPLSLPLSSVFARVYLATWLAHKTINYYIFLQYMYC